MHLADLIEQLSRAEAYPHQPEIVEVRQTHISVVFLAGTRVYKIKKPVRFDFLDFRTLADRQHFCHEEVRLNRRLAAEVYLGVVPITAHGDHVRIEGDGEPIEWAVQMLRLPEEATLKARLETISPSLMVQLAERIAAFHATAPATADRAAFGCADAVAGNVRGVLGQARAQVGDTIDLPELDRLETLFAACLARHTPRIDARAARGMVRDGHGDLHLGHIYHFPERPDPFLIVDCIEFNERLRCVDPVADMAFLVMDLAFHNRPDLASAFAQAYFSASGDAEGQALVPLYAAYRACVRGLVDGLKSREGEVSTSERDAARQSARDHWQLALVTLQGH